MGAVFLGTPAAAIPSLTALADVEDVDLVITQPDRRGGRGNARLAPPVKAAAQQFGFRLAQPDSKEELAEILITGGFNIGVVVAYGRILSPTMLAAVPLGFLNVHFSLLPRWRGAAPVERAIVAGDARTGVTLMKIDEGLDTGPVLAEIATPIGPNETGGSLTARLSYLGASLIDGSAPEYLNNRRRPVPQIASGVRVAKRLTKEEARLLPAHPAGEAERMIRAFHPRPIAWMETSAGALRVHRAVPTDNLAEPGQIIQLGTRVIAGFTDGSVEFLSVQPADRTKVAALAWINGLRGESVTFG
ncbi:MAG: methionyl-tRNA formyltransferase [Actinomycetota bacterium]